MAPNNYTTKVAIQTPKKQAKATYQLRDEPTDYKNESNGYIEEYPILGPIKPWSILLQG